MPSHLKKKSYNANKFYNEMSLKEINLKWKA